MEYVASNLSAAAARGPRRGREEKELFGLSASAEGREKKRDEVYKAVLFPVLHRESKAQPPLVGHMELR